MQSDLFVCVCVCAWVYVGTYVCVRTPFAQCSIIFRPFIFPLVGCERAACLEHINKIGVTL